MASIVYFLRAEAGGAEAAGHFRIADPRVALSCRERPGYVTTPWAPDASDGVMVLFPGSVVHYVEPYWGKTPRISLAWNVNPRPLAERNAPFEDAKREAAPGRQDPQRRSGR